MPSDLSLAIDIPGVTNAEDIARECADMIAVYEILIDERIIPTLDVVGLKQMKKDKVLKYIEYAKDCGTIKDS